MLTRQQYLPPAGPDCARWCSISYIDGDLAREEIHSASSASDAYVAWQRRTSPDNGRTWTPLRPLENVVRRLPGGGMVTFPGRTWFEPTHHRLYSFRMRRLWPGNEPYTYEWSTGEHPYNDHTFVVETGDDGVPVEKLLRYEEGPDWDPDNPFDAAFCQSNRAYLGVSPAFAPDGTVYYPIVCHPHQHPELTRGGIVLMRRDPTSGDWSASNPVCIDPEQSSRGLLEPDLAVLADGAVLVVARGSNTDTSPGRKWMTLSRDGGRTLEPVRPFAYDDGDLFYSPSSIHAFLRSSRNGRLYWLANIAPEPPAGNGPRYPLYLAEIDEEKAAVRRRSLLRVDDRGPGDSERLQLSNFCLLEDRATGDVEIYLTRIGESTDHFWGAGVCRYIFSPPA